MLNQKRLKELLRYDPDTGVFVRIEKCSRHANRAKIGDVAGSLKQSGYVDIRVDGKLYKAHRLAWLYMTGEWPSKFVDHIDTIKNNNSWVNLRDVSHAENLQNQIRCQSSNASGYLGVSTATYKRGVEKYKASITVNKVKLYLGTFDDPAVAHAAYVSAKSKLCPHVARL